MARSDYVELVAGGQRISTWSSYSVDSRLLTPSDGFRFAVRPGDADSPSQRRDLERSWSQVLAFCEPGKTVQLYVGGGDVGTGATIRQRRYLQLTGIIDERRVTSSREGSEVTVEGRDLAAYLVDASVPVNLTVESGTRFLDLVRAAVAPWSIEVVAAADATRDVMTGRSANAPRGRVRTGQARGVGVGSESYSRRARRTAEREGRAYDEVAGAPVDPRTRLGSANAMVQPDVERLTVREARPRAGETVWQFLERHARRLGLLMWMDPRGRLNVSAPRYDTEPLYAIVHRRRSLLGPDGNNVLEGTETRNDAERHSVVTVYGRSRGDDLARSTVVGVAKDATCPINRPLVIHDNAIRSSEEASRRAAHELAKAKASAHVLEYVMPHHGMGNYLFAPDTVASVLDETTNVSGRWYVTDRTFDRSREHGTRTRLRLIPVGTVLL